MQDAPANRNQDFYNVVFNTPDLGRNRDMGWNGNTIGGNVHVINTGGVRWQMSSVAAADTARFTILGDVIVEDGQFAVQGTGNALTLFEVFHYGNLIVNGGNFSIARGSQGNGSGSTIWYLFNGDFMMSDATTQNSNSGDAGGVAKYVFASADTQYIAHTGVDYGSGRLNIDVSDSTTLIVDEEELIIDGHLVNYGEIVAVGQLTIDNGGVYDHARNGGAIPASNMGRRFDRSAVGYYDRCTRQPRAGLL
jgi:predicted RecA/RadA family phage recombinase